MAVVVVALLEDSVFEEGACYVGLGDFYAADEVEDVVTEAFHRVYGEARYEVAV